jgi:signal transduction histidine kinase
LKKPKEEKPMVRNFVAATVAAFLLTFAAASVAQAQSGTAAEARAMLDKAVAALKANKTKALADFNSATGGFRDRDLYVFCANATDNKFTAHVNPQLIGTSITALVDKDGKKLGEEIMKAAAEGKVSEVQYKFPRPGQTEPVQKESFVTKVGDQVCGVGYYK